MGGGLKRSPFREISMKTPPFLILFALILCLFPAVMAQAGEVVRVAPASALSITSSPSGAAVSIDGTAVGTTPYASNALAPGRHAVVLSLSGYMDYSTTVTTVSGTPLNVAYTLTPVLTAVRPQVSLVPVPATSPPVAGAAAPVTTTAQPPVAVLTATLPPATTTPAITLPAALPVIPIATPTPAPSPAVPPGRVLSTNPSWHDLRLPGPVSIQPLTIHVGAFTKTFHFTTLSPYFSYQASSHPGVSDKFPQVQADVRNIPTSFLEVDTLTTTDDVRNYYSGCGGEFCAVDADGIKHSQQELTPVWGDEATFTISLNATDYTGSAFRWTPDMPVWTGALWQVSRFPFSTNASDYQNEHIPGLVASGPVKDFYVDGKGFHYFMINFARVARHNPGDPPYYDGPSSIHETAAGQGYARSLVMIPGTRLGIYTDTARLGPLSLPYPAGATYLSGGELSEREVGLPNTDTAVSTEQWPPAAAIGGTVSPLLVTSPNYYVRVVPVTADGTAGVPSIPVEVTVVRPEPCPPCPPADAASTQTFTVKPPSVQVDAFYMTSFVPDWIHTDDQGNLVSRAHYVSVSVPENCNPDAPVQSTDLVGIGNALDSCIQAHNGDASACSNIWDDVAQCNAFKTRAYSHVGYHFYSDPPEGHWYDILVQIVSGLFSSFEQVIDGVSGAWNTIVTGVINAASVLCGGGPGCKAVMSVVVNTGLSALGVPPTVPNFDELETMGADYMISVAADQIGAGSAYAALPPGMQQAATGGVTGTVNDLVTRTQSATGQAAGSWYVPDPLYYQPHPATLVVKLSNPNSVATDPMVLKTKDTANLFRAKSSYVPPLQPGESLVIPMTLEENFDTVAIPGCTWNTAYTSDCDEAMDTCIPCYWNQWIFAAEGSSDAGGDSFVNTFSTKITGNDVNPGSYGGDTYYLDGLDENWGGKTNVNKQQIIDVTSRPDCPSCSSSKQVTTYISYPAGWQITTPQHSEDLRNDMWLKYSFSGGTEGMLKT